MNIIFILLLLVLVILLAILISLYSIKLNYTQKYGGNYFSEGDIISTNNSIIYRNIKYAIKEHIKEKLSPSNQKKLGLNHDLRDKCLNNLGFIIYKVTNSKSDTKIKNYNCYLLYPKIFDMYKNSQKINNANLSELYKNNTVYIDNFITIISTLFEHREMPNCDSNIFLKLLRNPLDIEMNGLGGKMGLNSSDLATQTYYGILQLSYINNETDMQIFVKNTQLALYGSIDPYSYSPISLYDFNQYKSSTYNIAWEEQCIILSEKLIFFTNFLIQNGQNAIKIRNKIPNSHLIALLSIMPHSTDEGDYSNIAINIHNIQNYLNQLLQLFPPMNSNDMDYSDINTIMRLFYKLLIILIIDIFYQKLYTLDTYQFIIQYITSIILQIDNHNNGTKKIQKLDSAINISSIIVSLYRIKSIFINQITIIQQLIILHNNPINSDTGDISTGTKSSFEQIIELFFKICENNIRANDKKEEMYRIANIEITINFIQKYFFDDLSQYNKNYMTTLPSLIRRHRIKNIKSAIKDIGQTVIREKIVLLDYLSQFSSIHTDIFQTTIQSNDAIIWTPMGIKPISDVYGEIFNNNAKQKSIIFQFSHGSEADFPPIELRPNEYILMNCNPWLPTISPHEWGTNFLLNQSLLNNGVDDFKFIINKMLGNVNTVKYTRNILSKNSASEYISVINNFCLFTNKCPDIELQFFNLEGYETNPMKPFGFIGNDYDKLQNALSRPILQYPVKYESQTIEDLITKIETKLDTTIFSNPNNNTTSILDEYQNKYNAIKHNRINNTDYLLKLVYNMAQTDKEQPGFIYNTFDENPQMELAYKRLQLITEYLQNNNEINTYNRYINPNMRQRGRIFLRDIIEDLRDKFPDGFLLFNNNCRS